MLRFLVEHRSSLGRITRAEFLRLGGFGALAAAARMPGARAELSAGHGIPRAKSVIVVFASGGQSQFETWDPKPDAPLEVRGEFRPIATSVPGTIICEHLPLLAQRASRYALIRTMSHADVDHGSAVYLTLTGQYHPRISSNPKPAPTDLPSLLSVYKRLRPHSGTISEAIALNGPAIVAPHDIAPGQFGGLLGRDCDPLILGNVNVDSVAVPGLARLTELPPVRVRRREQLLSAVERFLDENATAAALDFHGQYRKAFALLDDPRTREAFDLSAESPALRERYGRHRAGQACLLARRLAEAGVPLITVVFNHHSRGQDTEPEDDDAYGWDTHNDIFDVMRSKLLPRFDQTVSALLDDLAERGLLDETLLVCLGEFGRAPLVALERTFAGSSPGRKHWAAAYSIMLAGAGIAAGTVVGRTDRHGAYPATESYGPWDLAATLFAALGVDPGSHYVDPFGRPLPASTGRPIKAAYSG